MRGRWVRQKGAGESVADVRNGGQGGVGWREEISDELLCQGEQWGERAVGCCWLE